MGIFAYMYVSSNLYFLKNSLKTLLCFQFVYMIWYVYNLGLHLFKF